MQGGLLNQEKPFLLPADFQPSQWDITIPCGWVKSKEHSGNARFLEMCQQQLENYEKCTTKVERSVVIHRIVLTVMAGSPTQTGFVNRDKTTGRWHFIGMTRARERVGYVLRRAIADKKAKREKAAKNDGNTASPTTTTKTPSASKSKKTKVIKSQGQTGLTWSVSPTGSKLDSEGEAAKALALRRRKLPIGLTRKSSTSSEDDGASPKRRRISLQTVKGPFQTIDSSTPKEGSEEHGSPQSAALEEAIAIAKPSATEISSVSGIARPLAAYPSSTAALLKSRLPAAGLPGPLFNGHSTTNDIYLEAAIREHAALRERSMTESSALRELAAWREQAADAVLRERLAMQEQSSLRERLALQENAMLRERLAMHEEAAAKKSGGTKVSDAIAAAKAMKAAGLGGSSSLTPAQRAAILQSLNLGTSSLGSTPFSGSSLTRAGLPASLYASLGYNHSL